jgi:hypothetical protein
MADEQNQLNQIKYRRPVNIKNDGYKKNGNTVQDNLTPEDIELLLEEYEQIASFDELKEGMHIRYYTTIKKKQVFRLGGTIIKIDLEKKFAVVTNGHVNWSVQLNPSTIIYRKMTTEEVKAFYENELDNKEMEIKKYKTNMDKLKTAYRTLYSDNEELKKELIQIKKLAKKAGII